MSWRTLLLPLSLVLLALAAAPAAPIEVGDTTEDGFLIVGEDPAGDWGSNVSGGAEPVGDASGQDLVAAQIAMDPEAEEPTLLFRIVVNSLPPLGGAPEVTRYTWNFTVDGTQAELDGKYTNYSRGACDPLSASCPPPRDPGMQPFQIRGNCTTNEANVISCEELAVVQATFDPDAGTITVPVPVSLFEAGEACAVVGPGTNFIAGSVSAAHAAYLTYGGQPADTAFVDLDFRIPDLDGAPCPED